MKALKLLARWIDNTNERIGRAVAWVTSGLVTVVFVPLDRLTRRLHESVLQDLLVKFRIDRDEPGLPHRCDAIQP